MTSVGKIHLPSTATTTAPLNDASNDDDSAEDPLSPDFLRLLSTVTRAEVDKYLTRCPHAKTSEAMAQRILRAKAANDSIGGTVTCVIRNAPPGLGEPVFDKFEATLAHAVLSIPATKAFEIGSGFKGTEVPGSRHNDPFVKKADGTLGTQTNWSGGIQGGITNGENIYFRYLSSLKTETSLLTILQGRLQVAGNYFPSTVDSPIRWVPWNIGNKREARSLCGSAGGADRRGDGCLGPHGVSAVNVFWSPTDDPTH